MFTSQQSSMNQCINYTIFLAKVFRMWEESEYRDEWLGVQNPGPYKRKVRASKWEGNDKLHLLIYFQDHSWPRGGSLLHHFSSSIEDLFFISFKHSIILSFLPQTHPYVLLYHQGQFLTRSNKYQIKRVSLLPILLHLFSSLFCESVKKTGGAIYITKTEKWRDKEAKGLFQDLKFNGKTKWSHVQNVKLLRLPPR